MSWNGPTGDRGLTGTCCCCKNGQLEAGAKERPQSKEKMPDINNNDFNIQDKTNN